MQSVPKNSVLCPVLVPHKVLGESRTMCLVLEERIVTGNPSYFKGTPNNSVTTDSGKRARGSDFQ